MPYREVTMFEVKEILRRWLRGTPKKQIARQLKVDPKTVRSYVAAAEKHGLRQDAGESGLTDELVVETMTELRAPPERPRGDAWGRCVEQRPFVEKKLGEGVRLAKVRRLLRRNGVDVPYATLHRYAVETLGFGKSAPTVPVADGKPGEEVQLDTGWVLWLEPDLFGKRRHVRAWIFTAAVSRHRFAWPCARETTASAIEACEAAWEFFDGVFAVVIPDNTRAIVQRADPIEPLINKTFLEYSQARGFVIDTTRVRRPKDKARVERSVPTVRDDCFGGEHLQTIEQARVRAGYWSRNEYGQRRHTTTGRMPVEHFESVEKAALKPAPTEPYDVPIWCEPVVGRDHYASVAKALYSLPTAYIGRTLRARADRSTVRFYDGEKVFKVHPRQVPGGRSTDETDFPPEKAAYARRDVEFLKRDARRHGDAVGRFAERLLAGPLPWTRMRRVYVLRRLVQRYGAGRVDHACALALAADMVDVRRLERMLALGTLAAIPAVSPASVAPAARHARPASDFALQQQLPLPTIDTEENTHV